MDGSEGAFSLCTLWAGSCHFFLHNVVHTLTRLMISTVEALTRAGEFDPCCLERAEAMFEDFLGYGNHVGLFSEEISMGGEGLGNLPQGFSSITLISTAFNLDRMLG